MTFPATPKIAIIGLGYVGLPLAVEFGKKFRTMGFDIKQIRIDELNAGHDRTREVDSAELRAVGRGFSAPNETPLLNKEGGPRSGQGGLMFTSNPSDLAACNVFIVTVPTPVDSASGRTSRRSSEHPKPSSVPWVSGYSTVPIFMGIMMPWERTRTGTTP